MRVALKMMRQRFYKPSRISITRKKVVRRTMKDLRSARTRSPSLDQNVSRNPRRLSLSYLNLSRMSLLRK